jgi:hypothetical protein
MRNKRVLFTSSAKAIACGYEKVRQPYTFNFINNAHNAYFGIKRCDMARVFTAIIYSCLAFLAACNKDTIDPFDAGYGIKAKLNGEYVELGNVTAGNANDCTFQSFCEASIYSPCVLIYSSRILSNTKGWSITISYKTTADKASLQDDGQNWVHQSFDGITALDVGNVPFAENSGFGVSIDATNLSTNERYATRNYPWGVIATDNRFFFRFSEDAVSTANNYLQTYSPTYQLMARGEFSAMLYSNSGDSLSISEADFQLLFCE